MAENIPGGPAGAVPPKKETGKVQPKKETVRINLPPKPSAAPTIKLPTLPPGGPAGGPAGAPAPVAAPAHAGTNAHAAPAAPRAVAAPVGAPAPKAAPVAAPAPRPVAASYAPVAAVSTADKVLAVFAIVVGLAAAGSTIFIWLLETQQGAGGPTAEKAAITGPQVAISTSAR